MSAVRRGNPDENIYNGQISAFTSMNLCISFFFFFLPILNLLSCAVSYRIFENEDRFHMLDADMKLCSMLTESFNNQKFF